MRREFVTLGTSVNIIHVFLFMIMQELFLHLKVTSKKLTIKRCTIIMYIISLVTTILTVKKNTYDLKVVT